MTYRKLLELYRQGNLDEGEKEKIEKELEKFEAMSDYLFQEEAIPELEELEEFPEEAKNDHFVEMIEASIRKAFIKMGTVVGAVVLILVLLIIFVVPEVVSRFYYDPARIVGEIEQNGEVTDETNQMSLDMAVYTEMMLPGYFRDVVEVEDRGYGEYDICIRQNVSYNGEFHNVSGKIERGDITLYQTDSLKQMVDNQFDWYQRDYPEKTLEENDLIEETYRELYSKEENSVICHGAATRETMEDKLYKLEEGEYYLAYVSLNSIMSYNDFQEFIGRMGYDTRVWCAVKCGTNGTYWRPENIGFYCTLPGQSTMCAWDEAAYPNLLTWHGIEDNSREVEENIKTEYFAKEHFMSMLNYMADQEEFCEMMELQKDFETLAAYVRENGIEVYGFVVMQEKEELIELSLQEEVYVMDIKEMY